MSYVVRLLYLCVWALDPSTQSWSPATIATRRRLADRVTVSDITADSLVNLRDVCHTARLCGHQSGWMEAGPQMSRPKRSLRRVAAHWLEGSKARPSPRAGVDPQASRPSVPKALGLGGSARFSVGLDCVRWGVWGCPCPDQDVS